MNRKLGWITGLLTAVSLLLIGCGPYAPVALETRNTQTEALSAEPVAAIALQARKQLVLLVPELEFAAWQAVEPMASAYPHLRELLVHGGVGAVTARTLGRGIEDFYASLGAGAPAGSDKEIYGLNRNEEKSGLSADRLFARYRGLAEGTSVAADEVLLPEFARAEQVTSRIGYEAVPGLLGESLKGTLVSRYAYGNADGEHRSRYAAFVLTDRQGRVEHGDVGSDVLQKEAAAAFGLRMNGKKLLGLWKAAAPESVVTVEWGDLSRLEEEQGKFSASVYEERTMAALGELDAFIGDCLGQMAEGEGIWLVSAGNHLGARQPGTLQPLLYYEKGIVNGLLRSDSTRRQGIVTLYDLSATILARYGVSQPPEMIGRPIQLEALGEGGAWPVLRQQLKGIRSVYVLRPKLLLPFAGYEAIVLLAALLLASWTPGAWSPGSRGGRRLRVGFRLLLLSLLMAPLAMLALGWLMAVRPVEPAVLVVGFVGLVGLGSLIGVARPLGAAVTIAAVTAAALLGDGLLGAEGMKRSLLGYDPVVGARFYGIGNEYMGVLLGAVVLAVSWGLQLSGWAGRRLSCEGERGRGPDEGEELGEDEREVEVEVEREGWGKGSGKWTGNDATVGELKREPYGPLAEAGHIAGCISVASGASAATPPLRAAAVRGLRQQRLRRAMAIAAVACYVGVAVYLAAPQLGSEAGGAIAASVAFGLASRRSLARLLQPALPARRLARSRRAAASPGLSRARRPLGQRLRAAAGTPGAGWRNRARRPRLPAASAAARGPRRRAQSRGASSARALKLKQTGLGRLLASCAALIGLALVGLWLLNAVLPPPAAGVSHVGSAMLWIQEGRFDLIGAMIRRKLHMNFHLLGVSAWSKVLLAGLLVMLAAVLRPRELQKWQNSHPYLMDGCSAITVGALVALLVNDSGIVAAGTMIIYAAIPVLLLKLR